MISANDVLQVISEIHQYSILLLELKDATTVGISHSPGQRVNYFKLEGRLGRHGRVHLVEGIYDNQVPESMLSLSVEEFLREIEGKKTRHIWLETVEPERKEMAFLSISELKTFLKNSKNH
jgi:hypothetical protein